MCGICGFAGFRDDALLRSMTELIAHRGLDDEGHYFSEKASLGFRRLSIIDISHGNQPFSSEDGLVWSVCNGEIYNFKAIKELLLARGHRFRTNNDTEIIPHAYQEWGIDFIARLNGMFAFALWDEREGKLFLVRDRLGIRPLHYSLIGGGIVFASEAKAILKHPGFNKELDYSAIDDFLTLRYIPGDVTFFNRLKVLEPAHMLVYQNGQTQIKRYWDIPMQQSLKLNARDYRDHFYSLLDDSVNRCLLSDVPLGVYLSGGLDSSVIAAFVKKNYDKELTVFSHGFDGQEDELKFARLVAKHLGARHHEVFIKEEHLNLLPEVIYHMDMPIANSDIIGFYLLADLAHKHVKVFLTGEGSDELFGSYVHQETLYYGHRLKKLMPNFLLRNMLPALIKKAPLRLINMFFRYPGYALDEESRLKLLEYCQSPDLASDYFCLNSLFSGRQKEGLYSSGFRQNLKGTSPARKSLHEVFEDERIEHIFNRLIYLEFKYWLPTYHLMKEDKIAMSFCLESRYPFLDHEIVEFMGGVPVEMKKKGLRRKYLLREVARGLIPEEIRNRPKGPILVPINKCFDRNFQRMLGEYFTREKVEKRGYYNYSYIKGLIDGRKKNPFLFDRQLFALLCLEIWHNIFVDRNP